MGDGAVRFGIPAAAVKIIRFFTVLDQVPTTT